MAQTSVGEIGLDLVVNQNQFKKQMNGIQSLAKKAGAALAAAFAVKEVVQFGKACLDLGSDLQEVQNVVDVTFPSMSAKVDEFAKSAASSFGLSETMAKQYTGTFGAMAKAFGFSESAAYDMGSTLTGLAGDVASFYNITQDEAYTKLKSVFTGETETLKDLGIVMTQNALDAYAMANGYGKTTAAMTEAEKVALRYAFVQNQLSAAQGDFARTSDGWANQVRILKLQFDSFRASIGQGLINVLTPVIKGINTLLGKLTTAANAFKSFTELITGKKSSGNSSVANPVSDLTTAAGDASTGLTDASGAADSLSDSTSGVGTAAKKAAKEMRSLMGFDQINKLTEQDTSDDSGSSGSSSPSGSTGAGTALGDAVDYGSLVEGETVVDKLDSKFDGLIKRAKELADLCKKGFQIGFGDSEKRIESIKEHLKGIGDSLKEIFTDSKVVEAANGLFDSLALNAGKIAGSFTSIGVTIADCLVGGIDQYLQKSKEFIKDRLVSIFDVSADISNLAGNFAVAVADIFSVFSGENAKNCVSSFVGIFSDGFLGLLDLAMQLGRDVIDTIATPIVENKDKFKEAIDNTLAPISQILDTLHQSVLDTFSKCQQVYDEHISPMFQSLRDGLSKIVAAILDAYNTYIAPVLQALADKFTEVWESNIQPTVDVAIEIIGKIADLVKALWENVLVPLAEWIINTVVPILAPVFQKFGETTLEVFGSLMDVVGDVLTALGGLIDFLTGVFTGDWELAWNGIKTFFTGIWEAIRGVINSILGGVEGMANGVINAVNSIAGAFNSMQIQIPDWVPGFGGGTLGFNLPTFSNISLPRLAEGGYVKANTPQLAMIGDNKHQGEVVAPEDKLLDMARMAAGMAGGVNRDDLENIINRAVLRIVAALADMGFSIDGETIAKADRSARIGIDRRFNLT